MSSFLIDKKYASYLSGRLELFSWIRTNLALARCPFCGDSAKKKTKRRFYIYHENRDQSDYLAVKCHNCSYAKPFFAFLKEYDAALFKEYTFEKFAESRSYRRTRTQDTIETINVPKSLDHIKVLTREEPIPHSVSLTQLSREHIAWKTVLGRKIPIERCRDLLYAEDFVSVVDSIRPDLGLGEKMSPEPRLIIPFYNSDNELTCIQGRAFRLNSIRYLTIKIDENNDKLFGMDRVDVEKDVYVVEGPIDSMFVDNCIATADSDLLSACKYISDPIVVFDNQYRNAQIRQKIEAVIDKNFRVVLFPEHIKSEDINDMILEGMSKEELMELLEQNTFRGLAAKLHFGKLLRR